MFGYINFLNYIYNNYGINTLENINTSYKNNTYSYNVWHDLTGNSLKVLKDLSNNNLDNIPYTPSFLLS